MASLSNSATPHGGWQDRARPDALAHWLFAVAAMVFVMVVVGGITRLTESGLSITEWQLITGVLPPLTQADWVIAFEKYKLIPEYIEVNGPAGMTLDDFKFIYFWEWIHRLLGRLLGLAYAVPLIWFWVKGAIPKGYHWRMLVLLVLGGSQGALGWYMVASGLADRTDVSHFRLAAHLLNALFIMGLLIWTALDLKQWKRRRDARPARLTGLAAATMLVLFVQLLLGAWVAGLNAGYIASDWPLMNDHLVPQGIDWRQGTWFAVTHDPYLIHFLHRWWAWVAVAMLVWLARAVKKAGVRQASVAIHMAFGTQILLGIATVMTGMNIWVAVLHQAVGALVVATTVWGMHVLGRMPRGSLA